MCLGLGGLRESGRPLIHDTHSEIYFNLFGDSKDNISKYRKSASAVPIFKHSKGSMPQTKNYYTVMLLSRHVLIQDLGLTISSDK
jgi:hypothetical protein